MKYKKIYDSIIYKAKSENRKKFSGVYYESHHIVPKCLGGGNEKENLVLLTAKEHYVCHKLLHWMYPSNHKLSCAYHSMTYSQPNKRKLKLTSREYNEARIAASIALKRENLSFETRKRKSESVSGENNPMFGKSISPESIEKAKETKRNKSQEEKDEIRRKLSEARKNKSQEEKDAILKKKLETINNKSQEEKLESSIRMSNAKKNISKEEKYSIKAKQMETKNKKSQSEKDEENKKRVESFKNRTLEEKHNSYLKARETRLRIKQERLTMIF